MLDVSPLNLFSEINAAERHRDAHLKVTEDLIKDYHGAYYRDDRYSELEPSPENHAYEWLALVTTKIIYDNPIVELSSRFSGVPKDILVRMKHAINQWAGMQNLWKTLLQIWYDTAFGYGVMRTTLQTMPGYKGFTTQSGINIKPQWPTCNRVSPGRFLMDARADTFDHARFMGHVWKRDHEDLMKAKGFNHEVVGQIAKDAGLDKARNFMHGTGYPTRNEIVGYEIWVPEVTLPEVKGMPGYHGTIYTLGVAQNQETGKTVKPRWIRKPRPYYGPSWGPYTLFGVYWVPGSVFPLSPLAATYEQVKELNAHAVAASRGAASYKKFVAFEPTNPNAGNAAKNAAHGTVVPIEGLSDAIEEIEIGGVQQAQYQYLAELRDRRDRVTGLNDASRGNVEGVGTATEIADAASQRDNRIAFIERMFQNSTIQVLNTAGWFLFNSQFSQFKMGAEAARELKPRPRDMPQPEDAEMIAGKIEAGVIQDSENLNALPFSDRVNIIREKLQWNPEVSFPHEDPEHAMKSMADISGISYEDLQLTIQPMSMQRTDQAMLQKRAQDQFQLVSQAAMIMPQTPWIKWDEQMNRWGQAMNVHDFGDILNMEILQQAQQQFLGMSAEQGPQAAAGNQGLSQQGIHQGGGSNPHIQQGRSAGREASSPVRQMA
jgi:hypothetical protein